MLGLTLGDAMSMRQAQRVAMWSVGLLVIISVCLGVVGWLVFVWAVKSGQYDDPEGIKYRMLEDDDEDDESKQR